MRAMMLDAPDQPLKLGHLAVPEPAAHDVLLKVLACGVCRTDLHILDGELPAHKPGIVPGHEVVGRVVALGSAVTRFRVGDRVGIPWLGGTCGHCAYCAGQHENLCDTPVFTGYDRNGGFAEYALADSIVVQQGPNYSVAKRVQQWRALEARARGRRVSLNIAPATTTTSVTHNPILAAGYAGADRFGIEVFAPETTRALMAALWVHDLRSDESPGNPARGLAHPHDLFHAQACHGGLWACPYLPRTALPFAAALGWTRLKLGR